MNRIRRLIGLLVIVMSVSAALLPAAAQGPGELPSTLQQVESVPLPPRDPVDLARRLNGVTDIPAAPSAPTRIYSVGDRESFHVENLDNDQSFDIEAELRYMNERVYMWVEVGASINEDALRRSADTFAAQTYPAVHAAFGSEVSPGIDGDPRLHILHARNLGSTVAAYFASTSLYPAEVLPTSNEHEMIYVNLNTMANAFGTSNYDGTLAHEFQHMVHENNDGNEDAWLNEGMSELASVLTGFDRIGFIPSYLSRPSIQLTTWPANDSTLPHYGAAALFTAYFHERFGDEGTRLLAANPLNGMISVADTLRQIDAIDSVSGEALTAEDVFADWTAANLLNDPGLDDGRFGYTLLPGLSSTVVQENVTTYPTTIDTATPPYSAYYVRLEHVGPGRVQVDFSGAEAASLIDTSPASGARMWYSNRGDESDATLTRAFDLSGVQTATLQFATWYDIEELWDYGYVMASTDGGATWDILNGDHTRSENPYHTAYGPGYTGLSMAAGSKDTGWITETVDLTPYAGQPDVLLRFEMITDDAINAPGMAVDDVSIPEIGYSEDFEAGTGGWESGGWLYIDNILPQDWIVQAVQQAGDAVTVSRLLMPADGASGTWTFDLGGPSGRVTLIISPVVPLTTESAAFSLNLTRVEE